MFVDTVAAMTDVPGLDTSVFQGVQGGVNFGTGQVKERYYLNPGRDDPYAPRCTYYATTETLRVEWSMNKMSLDQVNAWIRETFGVQRSVQEWRCQRVDYTADIPVDEKLKPLYLDVFNSLTLGGSQRQPFEGQGVVWKAKSRWVKFYSRPGLIRFEVSNYRDAVRYMSKRWFRCERTVAEMIQPGRVAFVLCMYWEKLGLARGEYGAAQHQVHALREAFGQRNIASAQHALQCIRAHGTQSYKSMMLISKSSYYRWLKALRSQGFLVHNAKQSLPSLHLSLDFELLMKAQNLKGCRSVPQEQEREKNLVEKSVAWVFLSRVMGFSVKNTPNLYLLERFYDWSRQHNLDTSAQSLQASGAVASVRSAGALPSLGVSVVRRGPGQHRSAEVVDRACV